MRILVALLVLSATAHAYVRSRTEKGSTPVYWTGGCVFIQPDSGGSPDLSADVVFSVVQKSMDNWMSVTNSCSYLQLKYVQPAPLDAHYDGVNVIKFRSDKWCHPDDAKSKNQCYDAMAAAITTVFYVDHPGQSNDGAIVDADVELNGINFTFVQEPSTMAPRTGTNLADFENTLTHELGHLMGLDHTCRDSATPANAVDDTGAPPPDCRAIPAAQRDKITEATMYNLAVPGEIKKRSPEADDVAGICAAYPTAKDPKKCAPTNLKDFETSGGCTMGGRGATLPLALAVTALCIVCMARIRTRRRA